MDPEGSKNLIAIVVMVLLYAVLVFSKAQKASRGAKK
jgi:hypothetical protein